MAGKYKFQNKKLGQTNTRMSARTLHSNVLLFPTGKPTTTCPTAVAVSPKLKTNFKRPTTSDQWIEAFRKLGHGIRCSLTKHRNDEDLGDLAVCPGNFVLEQIVVHDNTIHFRGWMPGDEARKPAKELYTLNLGILRYAAYQYTSAGGLILKWAIGGRSYTLLGFSVSQQLVTKDSSKPLLFTSPASPTARA